MKHPCFLFFYYFPPALMPDGRPRATLPHECREVQSLLIAITNDNIVTG